MVRAFWYGELSKDEKKDVIQALDHVELAASRKRRLNSGDTLMDSEEVRRFQAIHPGGRCRAVGRTVPGRRGTVARGSGDSATRTGDARLVRASGAFQCDSGLRPAR